MFLAEGRINCLSVQRFLKNSVSNYICELQQSGRNYFLQKICNLQILKQTLVKRTLRETSTDTVQHRVDLSSTLDLE